MNRAIARLALVVTLCVVAFVPLYAADVDGKVTVRLESGELKLEMTAPQSVGPAA